jgi:hypothetical protein
MEIFLHCCHSDEFECHKGISLLAVVRSSKATSFEYIGIEGEEYSNADARKEALDCRAANWNVGRTRPGLKRWRCRYRERERERERESARECVVVATSELGGEVAQERMVKQNLPTPILCLVPRN